jgi:hydroxymethylbilane synthase
MITIATRQSKLALWQSNHIKDRLKEIYKEKNIELLKIMTKGDKILDTPLALIGGKGLFTKEIEVALLEKKAQLAVHSLKDVPTQFEQGLNLSAVTKREDVRDALLSEKYSSLDNLPKGAVVGTTSLRRRMQILAYRDDLKIKELRGNVDTRIQKMKNGEYDAIILAMAGLNRLEIKDSVKYVYPVDTDIMIPSMGQGALGIETTDDEENIKLVEVLNDENTYIETYIEREFVDTLQGGCQVPIGVNAKITGGDKIYVKAMVGLPNGKEFITDSITTATKDTYLGVGKELADKMISNGAKELLKRAEEIAFKE